MSIEIITIPSAALDENTYIIKYDKCKCLIIDPGLDNEAIEKTLDKNKLTVTHVLLTHGHFDHCYSAYLFEQKGAEIFISSKDEKMIREGYDLARYFGHHFIQFEKCHHFTEGEMYIGNLKIDVIFTPGHTAGSVCFVIDGVLFSGDTLFYESVGNTVMPTGCADDLMKSIKNKLFMSGINWKIYPGHGQITTIEHEMNYNPYVKIHN